MNKNLLIKLLEASRDGQVYNTAKKRLSHTHDCIHDPIGDYCFFSPKKALPVLPILLVAHIDTVNFSGSRVKVVEDHGVLFNQNGILGADDRAGVFIILELMENLNAVPYILLTNHEEIGGIGVTSFCNAKILDQYLPEINMFVEFDRRGVNQYVSYAKLPTKIEQLFENYGYENHHGSYSDVATLSRHYDIAHVNFSAGYFNEHSPSEYCSLAGIQFAIDNAALVLPLIREQVFVEEIVFKSQYYGSYSTVPAKKSKKAKKAKVSSLESKVYTTEKTYATYDEYWEEQYGAINGKSSFPLDDTEIEGGGSLDISCPHCGSFYYTEVDHEYYYCGGCKDYYSLSDVIENDNLLGGNR